MDRQTNGQIKDMYSNYMHNMVNYVEMPNILTLFKVHLLKNKCYGSMQSFRQKKSKTAKEDTWYLQGAIGSGLLLQVTVVKS